MNKIIALNKFIVLSEQKEAERTQSGIIKAHEKGERTESVAIRGRIVSLGTNKEIKIDGVDLKEGDSVLVAKWEVQKTYYPAEYILARRKDIVALLPDEEKK